MGRIDAHDLDLAGEERKFLQRPPQTQLSWVRLDLGEELGGGEGVLPLSLLCGRARSVAGAVDAS